MIDLVFRNQTKSRAFGGAFFIRILNITVSESLEARSHKLGTGVSLSVNLVGLTKMRALNKKYRHRDIPTDVLSFPLLRPFFAKGYGIARQGFGGQALADKSGKVYNETRDLGDIFICPAVCIQRAADRKIPAKDYIAWATVHGFLHLAGYDHERSRFNASIMDKLEKKILTKLKRQNAKTKTSTQK